jgi:hypothetical protein
MENLDIIILSTILTTLFVIFIGFSVKELMKAPQTLKASDEAGPRANLTKFMGRLFDTPIKNDEDANNKIMMYKSIQKTISDMESDGVYFPDEVKNELKKKREELWCEYSNLPSVKSYE